MNRASLSLEELQKNVYAKIFLFIDPLYCVKGAFFRWCRREFGVLGAGPLGERVAPEQVRGRLQTRLGPR